MLRDSCCSSAAAYSPRESSLLCPGPATVRDHTVLNAPSAVVAVVPTAPAAAR